MWSILIRHKTAFFVTFNVEHFQLLMSSFEKVVVAQLTLLIFLFDVISRCWRHFWEWEGGGEEKREEKEGMYT